MSSWLSKRRERRSLEKSAALVTASPLLIEILRAWDGSPESYGNVYRKLPPVRTVVDFLADAVSTTSLKVYHRVESGRPEARNHPLALLLRSPNPELSARGLISGVVHDLGIYGNAYWRKFERGSTRWLVPLPPHRVTPEGGDILAAARYKLWGPGAPITLSRDEVVHFRLYNPEDRRIGSSKLESLRTVLAEEIEVSNHRANFWKNAARREGVLMRPEGATPWSPEARDRFRTSWQQRTAGSNNAGITPVLEEGMTWVSDSFSPREAEFIEGREFILEATARVYNVPVSLLGLTKTATFASQKEFHKALYQDTLPPWYELIQSEIELQLLSWFEEPSTSDVYVEFNVESKLRGSFEEQANILLALTGRPIMTVHEARPKLNLEDRHDPLDDELAIPTNNVSLGQPAPPDGQLQLVPSPAEARA